MIGVIFHKFCIVPVYAVKQLGQMVNELEKCFFKMDPEGKACLSFQCLQNVWHTFSCDGFIILV